MSYTEKSIVDSPIRRREQELLNQGYSYIEVAKALNVSLSALRGRNQKVYKIDIFQKFSERITRTGIPQRLNIRDEFGYWFSGFFDGEGCLVASQPCHKTKLYTQSILGISIALRKDDEEILKHIKESLGFGKISLPSNAEGRNPSISFRVDKIADLAEVIVPLFEKYPLRSKKGKEFSIWKTMVERKYVTTLGGKSRRPGSTRDESLFASEILNIRGIRHPYKTGG